MVNCYHTARISFSFPLAGTPPPGVLLLFMVVVAEEGEGEGLPCEWQTHQFGYFVKFTSCKLSSRKHPQKRTSFTALVCFTDLIENLFFYPNIVESVPSL